MKKDINSYSVYIENAIAIILSLVTSSVFLFKSPLHPWIGNAAYTDSSVFKTVALMMEHGYMPYRDTFDHKGPILYLINCLGNCISHYRGIWVIELFIISFSIFVMYKSSRLFCSKVSAVIVTLLSFTLMFSYYEGGNLVEEYALPCISLTLYFFVDYLRNNHLPRIGVLFVGISLGIVLLLRPNMIAVWVVFSIFVLINLLATRKYRVLIETIIVFVIGMTAVMLPVLIWLAVNNDLSWFWNDYIIFNRQYSSPEGGKALFPDQWEVFFTFTSTTVYIISLVCLLFHVRSKANDASDSNHTSMSGNVAYLVYMFIDALSLCLSGVYYPHYGMVLVPAMVYPLSLLFETIEKTDKETNKKALLMIVSVFSICTYILPNWINVIKTIPSTYEQKDELGYYEDEVLCDLVECIEENTTPDDYISVYGNYDIVYLLSNRMHATRYSYQFPVGQVMPEIMDEYFEQLQVEQPVVIVITQGNHDERISSFVDMNGYNMIWTENSDDYQSMTIYAKPK